MNYLILSKELKSCQNLDGESSNQVEAKAIIIVPDDEFVKVFAHQLKDEAYMLSKDDKVPDFNHI